MRIGQKIAGGAAILLFIDMFMSWYSIDLGQGVLGQTIARNAGVDTTANAWEAFSSTDLILFALIVATLVSLSIGDRAPGPIVAAIGALATLLVFWRILNQPGPNKYIDVSWGAYAGLLLCGFLTYGGIRELGSGEAASGQPVPA
jgi:hypothetical protein